MSARDYRLQAEMSNYVYERRYSMGIPAGWDEQLKEERSPGLQDDRAGVPILRAKHAKHDENTNPYATMNGGTGKIGQMMGIIWRVDMGYRNISTKQRGCSTIYSSTTNTFLQYSVAHNRVTNI